MHIIRNILSPIGITLQKHFTYALCTVFIFCAVSCADNKRGKEAIAQAELLMEQHPDSALAVLTAVYDEAHDFPRSQRMRYHLLLANAKNKAYADMSADSIMHEVADYYDTWGDSNEKMQANYLLGCVYRDRGDSPTALRYYNDAVNCADTTASRFDYGILAALYGQMSELYRKNDLAVYMIEVVPKITDASLKDGDTINALSWGVDMAYAFNQLELKDSALYVIREVLKAYNKHNIQEHANYAILSSMHMNMMLGNIEALLNDVMYYDSLYQYKDSVPKGHEQYYCYKAMTYMHKHNLDSAEIFYNKALKNAPANISLAVMTYKGLRDIHRQRGNHSLADKYSDMYCMANDSSFVAESKASVQRMHSLYNYNKAEKEKNQAERKAALFFYTTLLFVFIIITVIIAVCTIYKRKKQEQQINIYKINQELAKLRNKYIEAQKDLQSIQEDYNTYVAAKHAEIEKLKYEILNKSDNVTDHKLSIFEYGNVLDCAIHNMYEKIEQNIVPNSKDIKAVIKYIRKKMPAVWNIIIQSEKHLSYQETTVCVLLCAGFTTSEIAFTLCTSMQRITNIKTKLNMILFNAKGAKGLEERLIKLR